jgi:hypothetical protein
MGCSGPSGTVPDIVDVRKVRTGQANIQSKKKPKERQGLANSPCDFLVLTLPVFLPKTSQRGLTD